MAAISTGDLCKKLEVEVSVDKIKEMGFTPAARPEGKRNGVFWLESDAPAIGRALAAALNLIADALEEELPADDDSF
ncbi:hypothetical protein D3C87_687640 [compost metagenome]